MRKACTVGYEDSETIVKKCAVKVTDGFSVASGVCSEHFDFVFDGHGDG